MTRIISLRNLRPDKSAAYLRAQGVPEDEVEPVLNVTYGHPLALSLAADLFNQNKTTTAFALKQDPDVVRVLLERFVADVPDPMLRQALEVCAHAFTTDEALLAHCLGADHAHNAFRWLRDLSFIEQGPFGLFPHDLVRELLEAELRWRNLRRFRELHFQVRNYIIGQIQQRSGLAQQTAVFALLFLHRNNPFMRPFYEWQSLGHLYIDTAQANDMPTIEQLFRRHQGEESLAAARYWQTRPQATFFVFRAASGAERFLLAHKGPVIGAAWNGDESAILTWSWDGTARLWDATSGAALFTLTGDSSPVVTVQWSQDERRILFVTVNGLAGISATRMADLLEAACQRTLRNFTWQEWQLYFPGQAYRVTCPQWPALPFVPIDRRPTGD